MVPNGWKLGKISDLANTKMGYAFKSSDFVSSGIPLLRMGNLYQNSLDFSRNPAFLPFSYEKDYENFVVKPNDLVMSMTGTMGKRDYGFTVQIPEDAPISLLNQRVMKFIAKKDISSGYLMYVLRSEALLNKLYSFPGGTKQANLSADQVKEISVLIPSFEEQNKIAKILSTWDQAILATEKLIENIQQQKKALMQQLLTGKKRLLDETGLKFNIPWEKYRLGTLLKEGKQRNKDNSLSRVLSVTNHSGFVLPENQFSKRIASDEVSNYKVVIKGQFGYNPSRINVGSFARLDQFDNGLLSPMYVVFSITSEKLDSDFFLYWMKSNEAKQRINNSTQGSVRDSVGFDAISSFALKLPKIQEQRKIAKVLSLADQEIETLQKKLDCLKQEKKALMQQLLTGKKRVKVAA